MKIIFERPDRPTLDNVVDYHLPFPPRAGDWVSLGDEDEQFLVKHVVWHTHASSPLPQAPWAQVILKG